MATLRKNIILFFNLLVMSSISISSLAQVRLVLSAALIDEKFEIRKNEYLNSLNIIKQFCYEPYIVESIKTNSFFDNCCKNVFYSKVNDNNLKNKGVNEAKSLIEAFKYYNFDDNDLIIKLTGRYFFENESLICLIEDNPDIDAFIKTDKYGQVYTGCFALRCKYFKMMLSQLNLVNMEKNMINLELEVAKYINKLKNEEGIKVMNVDKLCVTFRFFGPNNIEVVSL